MNSVLGGQDGSKDVSLTEEERRLNSFEDIQYVSLEGCVTLLVPLDTTRARFFQIGDYIPDSRDEELGLDVTEDLENVSAMTHFNMSVLHNAFCQNGFLAD